MAWTPRSSKGKKKRVNSKQEVYNLTMIKVVPFFSTLDISWPIHILKDCFLFHRDAETLPPCFVSQFFLMTNQKQKSQPIFHIKFLSFHKNYEEKKKSSFTFFIFLMNSPVKVNAVCLFYDKRSLIFLQP